MQLRRELSLMLGTLIGLNVLLSFGVIALLVRMGPAIERILQDNVYSITAAEEMLATLAASPADGAPEESRARIEEALERIRSNVTEAEESPLLRSLDARLEAALGADPVARQRFVQDLRRLIQVNRDAMVTADEQAQRLGSGGAWAAVIVGVMSFAIGLVVLARMGRRFVMPLLDLHAALEAARSGETFRRCHARDAPREVQQVLADVNALLDRRLRASDQDATPG